MKYYEGSLIDPDNLKVEELAELKKSKAESSSKKDTKLQEEKLKPKKHLPPIL